MEAGVDLFVKKKKRSLFVHFQGHPEYGAQTLLKEYRRDIKRFLRAREKHIPRCRRDILMRRPRGFLTDFREIALSDRREEIMEGFPEAAVVGSLQNTWHSSAVSIYRNWLQYVVSKKAETAGVSGDGGPA